MDTRSIVYTESTPNVHVAYTAAAHCINSMKYDEKVKILANKFIYRIYFKYYVESYPDVVMRFSLDEESRMEISIEIMGLWISYKIIIKPNYRICLQIWSEEDGYRNAEGLDDVLPHDSRSLSMIEAILSKID